MSVQSYEKWSFFSAFSRLGFEWPILKMHEMIIVLNVVACPIIFILSDDRELQGGVLQIMKNDHYF